MNPGPANSQGKVEAAETFRAAAVQRPPTPVKAVSAMAPVPSGAAIAQPTKGVFGGPGVGNPPPASTPKDPTANYPPDVGGNPWTGGVGAVPDVNDLLQGMTKLTGITPPSLPPQDPPAGCKCCGAALTSVQKDLPVPLETAANVYVAYQIWHVDHFSGSPVQPQQQHLRHDPARRQVRHDAASGRAAYSDGLFGHLPVRDPQRH